MKILEVVLLVNTEVQAVDVIRKYRDLIVSWFRIFKPEIWYEVIVPKYIILNKNLKFEK